MGFAEKNGWKVIDTQEDQKNWRDNERRIYKIPNPAKFKKYRFSIEEVDGDNFLRLYEIKISVDASCKIFLP